MNKCSCCGGKYKLSTKEHVIQTRHVSRSKMVIENLPIYLCTICGNSIVTEMGQKMIQCLKLKVRKEMEDLASHATVPETKLEHIRNVFKRWIS